MSSLYFNVLIWERADSAIWNKIKCLKRILRIKSIKMVPDAVDPAYFSSIFIQLYRPRRLSLIFDKLLQLSPKIDF